MPNLATVTSIQPKTVNFSLSTTANTALMSNSLGATVLLKIESIIATNIDGVNDCDVSLRINTTGTDRAIASTITVPADSALIVSTSDTPIYLENGDYLTGWASAAGDIDVTVSYQIITCTA